MRRQLRARDEQRFRVVATVDRFGTANAYHGVKETLCLVDLRDHETGKRLTDHLWFDLGKRWRDLDLCPGDRVAFDARAKAYLKGYFGRREDVHKPASVDWKLSHPRRMEVLERVPRSEPEPRIFLSAVERAKARVEAERERVARALAEAVPRTSSGGGHVVRIDRRGILRSFPIPVGCTEPPGRWVDVPNPKGSFVRYWEPDD